MLPWLLSVRKILGKLTDYLTMGRAAGLWNKKDDLSGNPLGLYGKSDKK